MNRKFFENAIMTFFLIMTASAVSVSAATFTVTNTNDSGAGSLRQAILDANAAAGADTINFDASFNQPRTITLTSGQLLITNGGSLTINGPGMNLLTVSGNNQNRVFEISSQNIEITAVISNLTISRGAILSSGIGTGSAVGVNNGFPTDIRAFVTLDNVAITNNFNQYLVHCNVRCNLTINNSYIGNNPNSGVAYILSGAGGFGSGSNLTINNSTIEKNISQSDGLIATITESVTVTNSTINDNVAGNNGSGLRIDSGSLTMTNTTITRNRSTANAAVIYQTSSQYSATLTNVTIANNFSGSVNSPAAGFFSNAGISTINLRNTIIANNFNPGGNGDFFANSFNYTLNSSNSLIEVVVPNSLPVPTANGNIVGVDPLLDGALRNYGGATKTLALRKNSPAIDSGNATTFPALDQRGAARPQDGNGDGISRSDMGAFERRPNDIIPTVRFDFDNDGADDVSVFRPSNGAWYLNQSTSGFTGLAFGDSNDRLVPADYDGDGKTDIAVWRPSNGYWYLQRSSQGFTGILFGQAGDVPVPGDYDGDEKADIAVFRPSNGYWYLLQSSAGFTGTLFGISTDKPVPADYDGDGKTDIAVNRNGNWYLNRSQLGFTGVQFGDANDKSVPADYDGDGKADIAVFRPSNGYWYLLQSQAGFTGIPFGLGTDIPVAADYDGDGRADVAVVRNGNWYLNRTTQGFTGILFGTPTDNPIPNAFVR